ncbi:MAG: DUF1257 domain-containing protein [Betaproteobacteria bacterium]|nr:DUF1257 domain-containing protein [Betaproteobacteria bacterium]
MSHFTQVQTVIRDQTLLEETLRQLNYQFQSGERVVIRGYQGNQEFAQVVIDTGGAYDIGFQRQADQSFAVCADWWGVRNKTKLREESFLQELNRTYAHLAVKQQVIKQGLIIEEENILPNGEIELVVCERF